LTEDKASLRQLTTVRCPWEDVAARALKMLVDLIECGNSSSKEETTPTSVCLSPWVIPGDTV